MEDELETRLAIDVTRIDPEGEDLEGEIDCVGIDEELVKPFGGVRYRLHVQVLGTELLVQGTLEQDFSLVCSRCGRDFDDTVRVADFTQSYAIEEKNPEIDITEDLRESVLLELPNYPVCDEACAGLERRDEMPSDSRWSALDSLGK